MVAGKGRSREVAEQYKVSAGSEPQRHMTIGVVKQLHNNIQV